jgi:hypothetical protein
MAVKKRPTIDGLPVFDSKMDLIFDVKPNDIKNSTRKSCEECAASVAICRQYKVKEVRVYLSRALVKKPDRWERYVTPEAVRTEIICFDRTGDFRPGAFRLIAPKRSQQLGYKVGQKRAPHRKTGKPPRALHVVEGVRPSAPKGHYAEVEAD